MRLSMVSKCQNKLNDAQTWIYFEEIKYISTAKHVLWLLVNVVRSHTNLTEYLRTHNIQS